MANRGRKARGALCIYGLDNMESAKSSQAEITSQIASPSG